ncbi:MAG: threonine/serine dehydratase [Actinomycetota bacterium]
MAPLASHARPTMEGVHRARARIEPYLNPTPFRRYPSIGELVGAEIWAKHENFNPTGAFKVRGGVNLVAAEADDIRDRGVIAASTGNHGQSVAYAAQLFGVAARICVPEDANPVKVRAMRELEAEVIFHGKDFDDAREHCQTLAQQHGYRYVHSGDEPLLLEGVATYALELLEAEPGIEVILVPIGGGSGAAGTCIAAKSLRPSIEVIGVQSEAAPAAYLSWRSHSLVEDQMNTVVEGLATRTAFALPQAIMWELLDDFLLVSEDAIRSATLTMIEHTRTLVEGAGAAALAGALSIKERLKGRRVALICSGANVTPEQLRALFA